MSAMVPQRVFEPIRIRGLEVANRIVVTALGSALSSPRPLLGGDDLIAFHEARARGGVGLTILEATTVHPSSQAMTLSQDAVVERYRALMAAIRPHGTRVFQQLFHVGNMAPAGGGRVAWCVSTVPSVTGLVGEAMRPDQIDEVVASYADAARRCRDGGLDGVEVHAAHGTLPHQFLSPYFNTRTDGYGGSLPQRSRFLREVLRAIRAAVGDDFVVGVRMSASEMPGSIAEGELQQVLRSLEDDGLIDFLDASYGDFFRRGSITGTMERPAGYQLPSAGRLTAAVTVPSIVTGRIRTLQEAEHVLVGGTADMVGMVRAHIADPDLVRKTRDGRADEVRPCISCNQSCIGGTLRATQVGCTVNPSAGFERTLSEERLARSEAPGSVLVVGGGPAGLEAARVAALRGHAVTLVEASPGLGGALTAARRAPRFGALGEIVDWLASEVRRVGVDVVLGTRMSTDAIRDHGADAVIVATGSRPRMDGIQPARPFEPARGSGRAHVRSSRQLLTDGPPEGARTALVLDTVGHFEAIGVAEYLVDRGLAVAYVSSLPSFGAPVVHASQRDTAALEYLYRGEFRLLVRHQLLEIGPRTCVVRPAQGRETEEVPADVVVLVTQNEPNREIHDELAAGGARDAVLVGDALAPRDLEAAIAEGHRAGRTVLAGTPLTAVG